MSISTKLKLLSASILFGMGAAITPALAQDPDDEQSQAESESDDGQVVIVGSRLRRDNFNAPSPIQVITQEEATQAGFISTTEVLQSSQVTGGSAQINNLFGGFVVNGGGGVNTVGLRGFGPTSTLVLVNGRRLTPAGTRGAVGAADLNTIPSALVDHIEVLKDGASSIYGSDAVAGVINIITRSNVDDWTLQGQHNFTEQGGGEQTRLSLTGGGALGNNLHISGAVEYYERNAITRGDRDWATCNRRLRFNPATGASTDYIDPRTGDFRCYTTGLTGENGVTINTIGTGSTTGVGAVGATGTTFNRWRPASSVTTGVVGFEGVGGGTTTSLDIRDTFDPRMLNNDIVSGGENWNLFLQASYDTSILGNAEIYGEYLHSNRNSVQVGYRQLSLDYPDNSPLLPPQLHPTPNFQNSSTYPNPLPNPSFVNMPPTYATGVRAFIGFGNWDSTQDVTYDRYLAGIRGDFLLDGWRYDLAVSYGVNDGEYGFESWLTDRIFHSLNISPATVGAPAALVRSDPRVDPDGAGALPAGSPYMCTITATNPNYGCIPAPYLSNDVIAGTAFPQDWVNWTFVNVIGVSTYEETAVSFVLDGPLFSLPAGEVLGAFGIEYRDAEIDDTPNENAQWNNLYNLTAAAITRGQDSVTEIFGEVEIPVLANAPFADALSINLSARHTDYESYGADSTYKFGVLYQPIEGLTFRGTRGTSYRAPALFEQFLGATTGFAAASSDPCHGYGGLPTTSQRYINCHAEINNTGFLQTSGITIFQAGGAAQGLEAETSDNYTVGLLFEPTLWMGDEGLGRLQVAVDYFSILVDNQVTRVGSTNLLAFCYDSVDFRAVEPWCSYSARDGTNRLQVFDNYTNIAQQESFGLDYSLRYDRDIFRGSMLLNLNVTQYLEQSTQVLPTSNPTDFNGWLNNPEFVGDFSALYREGPWAFRWGTTWVAAMSDWNRRGRPAGVDYDVEDYYLHNVSMQYTQEEGDWQITLGVRNLEDTPPPEISAGTVSRVGNSPIYSGYDYFGRQFFVNVSTRF